MIRFEFYIPVSTKYFEMWRGIFSRRAPLDVSEKVDRQRFYQNRRLVCGFFVDPAFEQVLGSLVIVEGCGKWLKAQVVETVRAEVPEIISQAARSVAQSDSPDMAEHFELAADLTEIYCQLIWQLRTSAGKASDQILAACIDDPGIWSHNKQQQRYLASFCAPDALAEKSGLTIVDALPARDAAVGGNGQPLCPLPLWLMFADRDEKVSQVNRVVAVLAKQSIELIYLPASDGLDREYPGIRWQAAEQHGLESIKNLIETFIDQQKKRPADSSSPDTVTEVVFVGREANDTCDWFRENSKLTVRNSIDFGINPENIQATVAAILGLANLDQMPANVPEITGASSPRTLGRTTPGRPSNWRRVLLNMADYRPPAMKLRDAI